MATQRLTIAVVVGESAAAVDRLFRSWRSDRPAHDPAAVDQFCERLRANATELPIIHYCEWIDRWLMGDIIPGPEAVSGRRYEATCLSPVQAADWADKRGTQFGEQEWLAARLREAAAAWNGMADRRVIVVIREVIGPSTTDDEVRESQSRVPEWLSLG